jgi:PAS domain S-box-containing protein
MMHDGQTICAISDKVAALFRCGPEELIGRNIFDIIPNPEMRALARLRMKHIVTKGELHDQEMPIQRPEGSVFWARVKTKRVGQDTFVSILEYLGDTNPNYHGT